MARLDSPRLVDRRSATELSGAARTIAVVGPRGAGKTTLLELWSADRADVTWWDPEQDASAPPAGAVVIVDDADRLDAQAWRRLEDLCDTVPRLRLRLAVRSATALPAHWSVQLLSPYFDDEEIAECLRRFGSSADPRACRALTHGHPAAVVALARSGATSPAGLDDALAGATTAALPAELTDLAVPRHLTRRVVEALGFDGSVLDELESQGWGGWTIGESPKVFRLTPRRRAVTKRAGRLEADRRRRLHAVAAEALLAEGAHFPALAEAVPADRLDLAEAAGKNGGLPLLVDHGYELLLLLDPIPARRLVRFPALSLSLALAYNAREQHRLKAIEMVGVALAGARLGALSPADRALMRVIESVGLRITSAGDGGARAARAAARMLAEAPVDARAELGTLEPDLRAHIAISLLYSGAADEACEEFERAGSVHARAGVRLMAFGGVAMARALEGRIGEAAVPLAEAESRRWDDDLYRGYAGSMLHIARAAVAVEHLDLEVADDALDAVWGHIDTIEHWAALVHLRALVDIARGEAQVGLERFQRVRGRRSARRGATRLVQRRLDVTENLLQVSVGDLVGAKSLVPVARDHPGARLAAARVALLTGDHDRALRLMADADARTPVDRLTRVSLEAVLARRLGHAEAAAATARRAVAIVGSHGVRSPLMFVPEADLELFAEVEGPVVSSVLTETSTALHHALTGREQVVLRELVTTSSVQQIAARLHVSANTVKSQRRSLYRKLGATSREDAIATAFAQGLLDG